MRRIRELDDEDRDLVRAYGGGSVAEGLRRVVEAKARHRPVPGIGRRRLLTGLGASALLAPFATTGWAANGRAHAQAAEPKNLLLVSWPCGLEPPWVPETTGADYQIAQNPMLMPLDPHRKELLVMSGMKGGITQELLSHSQGGQSMWTGMVPGGIQDLAKGPSVEQLIASTITGDRPFSRLHTAVLNDYRMSGIATPYVHYEGPNQPVSAIQDPFQLYEQLAPTAGGGAAQDGAARERLLRRKQSVLDFVTQQIGDLRGRISHEAGIKLEQHTEHIRAIEHTLMSMGSGAACSPPMEPALRGGTPGTPAMDEKNFAQVTLIHAELLALAFQCGLTKVATLQLGETDCQFNVSETVGATVHVAAHEGTGPQRVESQVFFMNRLADIIGVLKSRGLLDSTVVVMTSEMNVPAHGTSNVPVLIAGGGPGLFRLGEHIAFSDAPQVNRLLVTLLKVYGIQQDSYGDGTGNVMGPLDTLLA